MQLLTSDRAVSGKPRRLTGRRRPGGAGPTLRAPVLAGRVLLWTVVALLLARSALGLVADLRDGPEQAVPGAVAGLASTAAVEGFAVRFAYDYLRYDAGDPQARAARLAAYMPRGGDSQLGWDGIGEQTVQTVVPLGVQTVGEETAVVTVAALVDDDRWVQLLVPVHSDGAGRFAVSAAPSFVAFAPPAGALERTVAVDADLSRELQPVLESFFRAFAEGRAEDLAYFAPVGHSIRGLQGLVSLEELNEVRVAQGGTARTADAVVRWRDRSTGAALLQRYQVGLMQEGGRWYVTSVGPTGFSNEGGTQ